MGQVRYTASHEWMELEDDSGVMGVTDRLSLEFGRIVYIEMPEVGGEYEQEEPMGRIEFATGDTIVFHAPLSGEVIKINTVLEDEPDLVNVSAEGDGWICEMLIEAPREFLDLMKREDYETFEEDGEEMDEYEPDDSDIDYDL